MSSNDLGGGEFVTEFSCNALVTPRVVFEPDTIDDPGNEPVKGIVFTANGIVQVECNSHFIMHYACRGKVYKKVLPANKGEWLREGIGIAAQQFALEVTFNLPPYMMFT